MDANRRILLLGGGGHCRSVLDCLLRMERYEQIGIVERELATDLTMGAPVVGTDEDLPRLFTDGWKEAFVTLGSIKSVANRRRLYMKAKEVGFSFPSIIDPSAVVSPFARVGNGVFVGKNTVINAEAKIGDMAIINTGAIIEHGCRIGEFAHISVGAAVCGDCDISDGVFVGANATVIQGVKIGMNSIIGAGTVVLKNVPINQTFVGKRGRAL